MAGSHSTPLAAVRHGRQKQRGPAIVLLRWVATVLCIAVVGSAGIAGAAVLSITSQVKPGIHLAQLPGQKKQDLTNIGAIEGGVNLLLAGTDTRTGQGGAFATKDELRGSSGVGNNDVTMLLHISSDHQNVTVVSFPRDLMVAVPSCPRASGGSYASSRKAMLNTTLNRGGLPCVVLTIEKLTGVQIPFAATITLDGTIAMSDAVGGVSVCLATPVNDTMVIPALHLAAGQQSLVGAQALSFLRTRHGVADGSDIGRISNQQVFLSALARKVTSGGVLSNPIQLYSLANAAVKNMQMSDTLTNPTTLVEIALALKNVGLANMVFLQFPVVTDPENTNRVVPLTSSAAALGAALAADRPIQLSGTPGRAAVLDPNAPVSADPTAPASGAPTTPPTGDAGSGDAVVLPSTITGQTAAQQTCTTGNH